MAVGCDWRKVLSRMSERFGYSDSNADVFSKIKANWHGILRDEVLERFCMPEYFENGILGVKANSAAAVMQFMTKKDQILSNANSFLPSPDVKNIIVAR